MSNEAGAGDVTGRRQSRLAGVQCGREGRPEA